MGSVLHSVAMNLAVVHKRATAYSQSFLNRLNARPDHITSHCFAGDDSFVPSDMEGVLLNPGSKLYLELVIQSLAEVVPKRPQMAATNSSDCVCCGKEPISLARHSALVLSP